jgi:hypothetical protein
MRLLAFDIETLGLLHERPLPEITCVCMHDGAEDFVFQLLDVEADVRRAHVDALAALLDAADRLVGYNAIYFDIEFLRQSLGLDEARALAWRLKCIDPFMIVYHVLGAGCKMQQMLEWNALGSKTGTGGDAIALARTGQWEELLHYCLMDARLVHQLVCGREWARIAPGIECAFRHTPPRFRHVLIESAPLAAPLVWETVSPPSAAGSHGLDDSE